MSAAGPRERDLVKCEDMRIHAERAREFLGERTLDEFLEDHLVQAAEIPWPLITGMRNVPAHECGDIILDKVYEVVTGHVPELIARLEPLIGALEKDVGWAGDEEL